MEESGQPITQNCTYIRNPGFPSAYSGTSPVSYTINKCSSGMYSYHLCILNFITFFITDVCWLRLDFESFTLQGVADTQELNGGVCLDSFSVSVCIYLNECHFSFIVLVIFSVKYWSTSSCHLRAKYWSTQ